jgi:hypothetical protein
MPLASDPVQLAPDGAFEIDCADIFKVLAPPGLTPTLSFVKGFVVIYSRSELDVSASCTSERVGSTTIICLLSNGTIVGVGPTPNGPACPSNPAAGVTAVGITTDNSGTGLALDVQYITPKTVALTPGTNPIGGQGR